MTWGGRGWRGQATGVTRERSPGKLGRGAYGGGGRADGSGWPSGAAGTAPSWPTCAGSLSPSRSFTLDSSCLMYVDEGSAMTREGGGTLTWSPVGELPPPLHTHTPLQKRDGGVLASSPGPTPSASAMPRVQNESPPTLPRWDPHNQGHFSPHTVFVNCLFIKRNYFLAQMFMLQSSGTQVSDKFPR